MTAALMTDRYEYTMAETARRVGRSATPCVFQVFARRLPPGRAYGVMAGLGPLLDAISDFASDEIAAAWLVEQGVVARDAVPIGTFRGRIEAMADGELWFPGEPVLRVEGTFAEAVVLETIVLSILNSTSAVASAASHMRRVAGNRTLFDMGGRRIDPHAAVLAARAAYIAGFDVTSNLEAGRRYGIPTAGTAAHASILLAPSEREAFDAQIASLGVSTTLLVDTFDIETGIRTAVEACRAVGALGPGAIRIDSGDLMYEVARARELLDELGATATGISVSGDLDETSIAALAALPVTTFGVGTAVATGSGHPTAGLVYKLVEVDGRPVAKRSAGKATTGGATTVDRLLDSENGRAVSDRVGPVRSRPDGPHRRVLHCVWDGGALAVPDAAASRRHHAAVLDECRALYAERAS